MEPPPRFAVMKDIRSTQIGQWDDAKGLYQICMIMHYPYDRHQAAVMVCEALNAAFVRLETEESMAKIKPAVGLNVTK